MVRIAGILGALGNDGVGVAGVSWSSPILPVRVLGKCGGTVSDIVDALRWAAGIDVAGVPHNDHPARVINLSLSGAGFCSNTEQSAITDVVNQGAVVVVATGDRNQNAADFSPGNCNGVINVAATDREVIKPPLATMARSSPSVRRVAIMGRRTMIFSPPSTWGSKVHKPLVMRTIQALVWRAPMSPGWRR